MSDKIQTEFAKSIIKEARKELGSEAQKKRPKPCKALKSCVYLASVGEDKTGFFCCGIWLKSRDEDIIRFCLKGHRRHREKFQMAPWESAAISMVLSHGNYFALLSGDPETFDIMENMGNR
ncbi:MAG: hypothetical protein ACXADO_00680 [Candidatus Thorarchaeota archaeon]